MGPTTSEDDEDDDEWRMPLRSTLACRRSPLAGLVRGPAIATILAEGPAVVAGGETTETVFG
jgi:hypothetical protein